MALIAALYEQMVDDNDEKLMKKKLEAEQTTNQTHHVSEVTSSQSIQQLSQRISSTLSTSSGYHRQSTEEIIRGAPPPSMLIDPHFPSDEGGGVQIEDSAHSTLVLGVRGNSHLRSTSIPCHSNSRLVEAKSKISWVDISFDCWVSSDGCITCFEKWR